MRNKDISHAVLLDTIKILNQHIQALALPQHEKNDILNKVKIANDRLERSIPQIAVVGEFSYGKSSLINALIGEELLLSAKRPTTQVPTFIHYGSKINAHIKFKNGDIQSFQKKSGVLRRFLSQVFGYHKPIPKTIIPFIQKFTADKEIASMVKEVVIEHPSKNLKDGIVLIDTPGLNAAGNLAHSEATAAILNSAADACIVMLDAERLAPNEYVHSVRQLTGNTSLKLLFVLNKMDVVIEDEDDSKKQVENVMDLVDEAVVRLKKGLNLKNPIVFPLSAHLISALNAFPNQREQSEAEQILRNGHETFIKCLFYFVKEEHKARSTLITCEILKVLLEEVLPKIQKNSDERKIHIDRLREARIAALSEFESDVKINEIKEFEQVSEHAYREMMDILETEVINSANEILSNIFENINSTDELKMIDETEVNKIFQKICLYANDLINQDDLPFRQLTNCIINQYQSRIDLKFKNMYNQLSIIDSEFVKDLNIHINEEAVNTHVIFSSTGIIEESDSKISDAIFSGAGIGAIVGSFIFPWVGTILGSIIGGFCGSLFGPSLDEIKNDVYNKILESFQKAWKAELEPYFSDAIENGIDRSKENLQNRVKKYVEEYSQTVDQLIILRQNDLDQLKMQALAADKIADWCTVRSNELDMILFELRQKSIEAENQLHDSLAGY